MQIVFSDNGLHKQLAPFTLTRPVAEIRFGILTIRESWVLFLARHYSNLSVAYVTEEYLHAKYAKGQQDQDCLIISGNVKPSQELVEAAANLAIGEALYCQNEKIVQRGWSEEKQINSPIEHLCSIKHPWHIFQRNGVAIESDYQSLTRERKSTELSDTNRVSGRENIFVEPGAKVEHAILNGATGPIYIGKDTEIMEGSVIRGPFALNEGGVVKMAAKIYGPTTIGPYCKVGGEISNCVFQAYSNKGHDGFLGNSVVGEWCNFGADTNSSNLKNNYSNVRVYSYVTEQMETSEVLFCGVLMGDHSKTGINTMLNTATVVGVSANIFGGDFPSKHIPSFTWGGVEKSDRFILEKAFEVAKNMMARRKVELTDGDKSILTYLYNKLA